MIRYLRSGGWHDDERVADPQALATFTRRVTVILEIMFVWLLAVGVVSVVLIIQNGKRQDDIKTQQHAIQQQRADSLRTMCREQNARHDQAVERLRDLVNSIPPGPRREKAQRHSAGTVSLIDALVPFQDCEHLVKERVQ